VDYITEITFQQRFLVIQGASYTVLRSWGDFMAGTNWTKFARWQFQKK